ncbi:MAG: branched-chain amino acid ABC transporter permease [Chloroflexota bacterium]|nr:branched-chain amino acid ABC transporter permease [Chloroflexota bacterium]
MELWSQALLIGLARGGIYALLASGLTLAYAVTKQLHLTHGNFVCVALYLCIVLAGSLALDPYISVLITAPVLFGIGILIYRYILCRVMDSGILVSFQIFLGLIFVIENLLLGLFTATPRLIPSFIVLHRVTLGHLVLGLPHLIAFIAALVIGLGFYWMLRSTDFGRAIRAVSEDMETASLMGIRVRRVQMMVWALAFVLIAVSASLVAPWWEVSPFIGLDLTLFALIILVIGGMGNFVGALVAGFAMGLIESIAGLTIGGTMAAALPYIIFIFFLFFRPQGLFRGV